MKPYLHSFVTEKGNSCAKYAISEVTAAKPPSNERETGTAREVQGCSNSIGSRRAWENAGLIL